MDFKRVLFDECVYYLQSTWDNRGFYEVRISDSVDYLQKSYIYLECYPNLRARLDHFFYPSKVDGIADVSKKIVEGACELVNFTDNVMTILKMIAVFYGCRWMALTDESVYPSNGFELALNALKPPYVSYYGKRGFFPKWSGDKNITWPEIVDRANSSIVENKAVAHSTAKTVEQMVSDYFNYKNTKTYSPPDPKNNPISKARYRSLQSLLTFFDNNQWLQYARGKYVVDQIPYSLSLHDEIFIIQRRFIKRAVHSSV